MLLCGGSPEGAALEACEDELGNTPAKKKCAKKTNEPETKAQKTSTEQQKQTQQNTEGGKKQNNTDEGGPSPPRAGGLETLPSSTLARLWEGSPKDLYPKPKSSSF